ncbi:hypothetical protein NHH03_25425 [Stieleria sp. TO1_6]|uniref:hypothetical protein n=1 Tax=Stieleria tagensis TaxID=2956795 RepID=UPI00209B1844|nr:hypothetical protein [Stieleria tagensis]MCO8125102.1 hypothetical protein [Stieleria tagensis]
MWTILAEKPLMLAVMIGIVVAGLLYGWLQTGEKRIAIAALVVALFIPAVFLVANSVDTDREKILDIIQTTAHAVELNDHEMAVMLIADRQTRQQALAELPQYDFSRVRVRNIKINMVAGSIPEEATVDLDASVVASQTKGGLKDIRVPRRVILTFQKQPDETWGVTDYNHMPLAGGPDGFSPGGN